MARGDNKGIILFPDMLDTLEMLNMEERGIILTAIFHHTLGLELPEMNKHTEIAFRFIKGVLDRNDRRYRSASGRSYSSGQSRPAAPKTYSPEEQEIHELCQETLEANREPFPPAGNTAADDWDDYGMLPF